MRADAFVSFQRDRSVADGTRFPVLHLHDRRHRNDFGIEASFRLRSSGAPVRFHRIFILCIPRDAVACRDNLGRLKHSHVDIGPLRLNPRVDKTVDIHLRGLDERNRFHPASNADGNLTVTDLAGYDGQCHQAG